MHVEQKTYYWTYEDWNYEVSDLECTTREKAQEWADDEWAERCEDGGIGDASADIKLIRFYFDDKGEKIIVETIKSSVEYEHQRSNFDEHNTLWSCL